MPDGHDLAHESSPRPFSAWAMLPPRIIPTTAAPVQSGSGKYHYRVGAVFPQPLQEERTGRSPLPAVTLVCPAGGGRRARRRAVMYPVLPYDRSPRRGRGICQCAVKEWGVFTTKQRQGEKCYILYNIFLFFQCRCESLFYPHQLSRNGGAALFYAQGIFFMCRAID